MTHTDDMENSFRARGEHVKAIVKEALAEDKREGGRFDREGWSNFTLEDWRRDPDAVDEAWMIYNLIRDGLEERHDPR
jgi:hypothetical protein